MPKDKTFIVQLNYLLHLLLLDPVTKDSNMKWKGNSIGEWSIRSMISAYGFTCSCDHVLESDLLQALLFTEAV